MALNKRKILYVDGYNVMNSRGNLKKLKEESLEQARDELANELCEYSSLSGEEVVLVFDAYKSDSPREKYIEKNGITIVFTKKFQTADTFIEKEIDRIGRRHQVRVCTGDGQIQSLILERGASRITALELKNELGQLRGKIARSNRKDFSRNRENFPISDEEIRKLEELEKKFKDK